MVVWVTGLAGSGKTTLCKAIMAQRREPKSGLACLDGDVLREIFGGDLGYGLEDRRKQVSRMQRMAKSLSDQGLVVLVAALYSEPALLDWNRENIRDYFEVFMDTDMETLQERDQKKLYSRARAGEVKDVVGVDIPWSAPTRSDLVIPSRPKRAAGEWAEVVIGKLPALREALGVQV